MESGTREQHYASLRNSVRTAGRIPRLFHPLLGDTRRSGVYTAGLRD
jgi:hypothetical protein